MRGFLVVTLAAFLLAGCASAPERDRNIALGIAAGAGAGALIGSAAGGPTGVWPGAAIGAATGGLIGALVKNEACYLRTKDGEVWQVPCDEQRYKRQACFIGPGGGPDGACQHL
jgi:uncharacterized protein YcfJ